MNVMKNRRLLAFLGSGRGRRPGPAAADPHPPGLQRHRRPWGRGGEDHSRADAATRAPSRVRLEVKCDPAGRLSHGDPHDRGHQHVRLDRPGQSHRHLLRADDLHRQAHADALRQRPLQGRRGPRLPLLADDRQQQKGRAPRVRRTWSASWSSTAPASGWPMAPVRWRMAISRWLRRGIRDGRSGLALTAGSLPVAVQLRPQPRQFLFGGLPGVFLFGRAQQPLPGSRRRKRRSGRLPGDREPEAGTFPTADVAARPDRSADTVRRVPAGNPRA